jgi:hypothetical protein
LVCLDAGGCSEVVAGWWGKCWGVHRWDARSAVPCPS